MKVERFEDLICWQKARRLTNTIYQISRGAQFAKDRELVGQIRAAATSSMSNTAEGFERWSRKEFIRFLEIAKASAGEVRSQLYVALDQHYLSADEFEAVKAEAMETSNTMGGLIRYLSSSTGYQIRETDPNFDDPISLPAEYVSQVPGT